MVKVTEVGIVHRNLKCTSVMVHEIKGRFIAKVGGFECKIVPLLAFRRVAKSVATLPRRGEPSKDLVSQSLSSKLTCERDGSQGSCS